MKLFNLPVTSNHPCLSKLLSINSNSWQELPKKRIRVLNDSSVRIWTITKHRIAPVLTFICGFFTASRGATLKFCWESLNNRDWNNILPFLTCQPHSWSVDQYEHKKIIAAVIICWVRCCSWILLCHFWDIIVPWGEFLRCKEYGQQFIIVSLSSPKKKKLVSWDVFKQLSDVISMWTSELLVLANQNSTRMSNALKWLSEIRPRKPLTCWLRHS